eukprot:gnl/TRDRNA2_/TRDRNA2_82657_c0_seq1.p1 gnl/TRDRNA2_/TRDRNA2_82657_c0~~gnl/TRDRNA2_/TRDRNA2_82657_c0_seq1.p1  ORF type:complete len:786 (-),score=152.60 gnl/TRDRNA2_/TRDRNA2_82657_c0_seq1:53-2410(-)
MGNKCCRQEDEEQLDVKINGAGFSDECRPQVKSSDGKPATLLDDISRQKLDLLDAVPLFQRLPKDQLPLLAAASEEANFEAGRTIVQKGALGEEFFYIKSGDASVFESSQTVGKPLTSIGPKDYFGDTALLSPAGEPWLATVKAKTSLCTLRVSRAKFQALGLHCKLRLDVRRRAAIGCGNRRPQVRPPEPKKQEDRDLISSAFRKNEVLSLVDLDDTKLNKLIDLMWSEQVGNGTNIIEAGSLAAAECFYIVQKGSFQVFYPGEDWARDSLKKAVEAPRSGSTVERGGSFGEMALMYFAPRTNTVQARSDSSVWVIDRANFKSVMEQGSEEVQQEYFSHLENVEVMTDLPDVGKKELAKALKEQTFMRGEEILVEGAEGETFYILYEGAVNIVKGGKKLSTVTAMPAQKTAAYFGENALLKSARSLATVTVSSSSAKVLELGKSTFEKCLGKKMPSLQQNTADLRQKIPKANLKEIGPLGMGTFGFLQLVENATTGESYMLKSYSKGRVVETCMQSAVMSEKSILMLCDSPFIVRLHSTYRTASTIEMLLDACLGGDLHSAYARQQLFGEERPAKFHVAGVAMALDHLHSLHVVYRNLKPESVLLDDTGSVKLADLSLAKMTFGKTYTTCGIPDYFAPEMIAGAGHTRAADWWCLGIFIYELMVGRAPFESEQRPQLFRRITKGVETVQFPKAMVGACQELVAGLLQKEPSLRLPMKTGGEAIRNSAWFRDFDWAGMECRSFRPPYVPMVKNKKDISNFEVPPDVRQLTQVPYSDDGTGWDADF